MKAPRGAAKPAAKAAEPTAAPKRTTRTAADAPAKTPRAAAPKATRKAGPAAPKVAAAEAAKAEPATPKPARAKATKTATAAPKAPAAKATKAAAAAPKPASTKQAAAAGPAAAPARGRRAKAPPPLLDRMVAAVASLEDDKAEDIAVLDISTRSSFADRMIVASGLSDRQLQAMARNVEEALAEAGWKRVRIEASPDWVLLDAGDVVIHLFRPATREAYGLERMWGPESPNG
jgi:ribosome-associated protein